MKIQKITFIAAVSMLCCHIAHGQGNVNVHSDHLGQKYKLAKGSVIYNHQNQTRLVTTKTKFNLVDETGDSLFIRLISDNNIPDSTQVHNGLVSADLTNNTLFYLLKGRKQAFKYSFSDWDIEPLTIPIKVRPPIDTLALQFDGSVTIGAYFGYQFGRKSYYDEAYHTSAFTICAFVAPSQIRVGSAHSSSSSVLGVSAGLGLLYDLDSFQIGLVSGVDFVGGSLSDTWAYQGKPWFSLSFGIRTSSTDH